MNRPDANRVYKTHCEICSSLDYKNDDFDHLKRKSRIYAKQFPLYKLPIDMIILVIKKMYYISFNRFRRTNREYYEYIEKHREHLRIAMFHDRNMSFGMHYDKRLGQRVPGVRFITKYYTWNYSRFTGEGEYHKHLYLSLAGFPTNEFRKRQLIGCYKPYVLRVNDSIPSDEYERTLNLFLFFLKFTKLSGVLYEHANPTLPCFTRMCQLIRPRALKIHVLPSEALCECKLKANVLFLYEDQWKHDPMALSRFKVLHLDCFKEWGTENLEEMIQIWIDGDSMVEEMFIRTKLDISFLEKFPYRTVKKTKSWRYLKGIISFKKFLMSSRLTIVLFEQKFTKTKAICALFSTHLNYHIYFKTIS